MVYSWLKHDAVSLSINIHRSQAKEADHRGKGKLLTKLTAKIFSAWNCLNYRLLYLTENNSIIHFTHGYVMHGNKFLSKNYPKAAFVYMLKCLFLLKKLIIFKGNVSMARDLKVHVPVRDFKVRALFPANILSRAQLLLEILFSR